MRRIERESRGSLCPGQDLVAAGYAGAEGARRIAAARAKELHGRFSERFIKDQQEEYGSAADCPHDWSAMGATEWEEAGEGGIYTALWNLSGAYMTGFTVDLRRIPVRQGTIEICEYYELNPYRLRSGGCLVLAADNGTRLAEQLIAEGIPAAVIGQVREGIVREVTYGDVHGFMERPREDELQKVPGLPGFENAPEGIEQKGQEDM